MWCSEYIQELIAGLDSAQKLKAEADSIYKDEEQVH
mgnify:CR=1 FL=1